jgi:hypothetical protein
VVIAAKVTKGAGDVVVHLRHPFRKTCCKNANFSTEAHLVNPTIQARLRTMPIKKAGPRLPPLS